MICPNCNCRWSWMPEGWTPSYPLDMEVEVRKNYEASLDELDFCPACRQAIGGYSAVNGKRHYYMPDGGG